MIFVAGCSSTATTEQSHSSEKRNIGNIDFPADAAGDVHEEMEDMQLAFSDRNLYLDRWGNTKLLSRQQCTLEISSHRGDNSKPENSIAAVIDALRVGYDTVEIDVMRLRDDVWIANHDKYTGFSTVDTRGGYHEISRYRYDGDYKYLRIRDPETRRPSEHRPPTASSVFRAFGNHANSQQRLNIEIKSSHSEDDLYALEQLLRRHVGKNRYYYSSADIGNLEKIRSFNPLVYLGFVQSPHPESIRVLKGDIRKAVATDPLYQSNSKQLEKYSNFGMSYHSQRKAKDHTSSAALNKLRESLGPSVGLHLDVRRYLETPNVRIRAGSLDMPVQTYTVNGAAYHEKNLTKLSRTGQLPSSVIIDHSPLRLCQGLYSLVTPKRDYKPTSQWGELIQSLPDDASFENFLDQGDYLIDGMYLNYQDKLKPFNIKTKSSSSQTYSPRRQRGDMPVDDKINHGEIDTIRIQLPE